jgi:hypothetical protein
LTGQRRNEVAGMERSELNRAVGIWNHVSGSFEGVKGIYQRYEFLPERKEAIEKWNNYIEQLIAPEP